MKNKVYIVLLCLACSLLSCTRTDSSTTTKELTQNEIAETIHKVSHSGLRGNSETLMKYVEMINSYNVGPTVKSLSIHPKGRKMLDELITVNDDENVTVQLKGIDKKYSISKEELKGAKELAQGDFDVRALEIAVYRYIHEKVDHKNVIKRIRDIDNDSSIIPISNDFYNGMNFLCTSYCILFGNEWCADEKPNKETIEKIKSGNYSTIVLSNNQYNMEGFSKHHVYAVTGADDNFVFLSNPYNPNEIQKMTHDDFLSFFKQCYSTEL